MKLHFVTGNQAKFEEVKHLFENKGIELEWLNEPKPEPADEWDIKVVAEYASEFLANKHQFPVIVEDTGFFFDAYENFPGPHSKFVFQTVGYDGIFRLLKGKERGAYFKVVASFCKPGGKPVSFEGIAKGTVTEELFGEEAPIMPYDRVFIPEGHEKAWILTPEVKQEISHRVKAFTKIIEFISNK